MPSFQNKRIATLIGVFIILLVVIVLGGGIYIWQYLLRLDEEILLQKGKILVESQQVLTDTANKLITDYLNKFESSEDVKDRLVDFSINNIKIDGTDRIENECFVFNVDFSVKTAMKQSNWQAGNGEVGPDNWINNKDLYISAVKEEDNYKIKEMGTGGGNLCVADETAGWQTYRNEEYGFEMKYPEVYNENNPDYKYCAPDYDESVSIGPVRVSFKKAEGIILKDYVNKYIKDNEWLPSTSTPWFYNLLSSRKEITLGGESAEQIFWEFSGAHPSYPVDIFAKKDSLIYQIVYDLRQYPSSCLLYKNQLPGELANQMLSTFKFLK